MDIKEYIASGLLELYVAGSLSEKENQEVYEAMQQYPEIKKEVEEIELAIIKLTTSVARKDKNVKFVNVKNGIDNNGKVINIEQTPKKTNWFSYMGWAASVALLIGYLWMFDENRQLKDEIKVADIENANLEEKIANANENIDKTNELIVILRDKNIESITLDGQTISPESYAKVYWNKNTNIAYVDVAGLPEPPPGKVYQVWSLTLDPLTPISIGILDDFITDENKVFTMANANESQAFAITLEPEGGSELPTLEQLYVLGTIKA
jgi:anti-sigma-K factor RskA